MQFFFGWIAGVLTCGVWFIVYWLENNGLPDQDDVDLVGQG